MVGDSGDDDDGERRTCARMQQESLFVVVRHRCHGAACSNRLSSTVRTGMDASANASESGCRNELRSQLAGAFIIRQVFIVRFASFSIQEATPFATLCSVAPQTASSLANQAKCGASVTRVASGNTIDGNV